MNIEIEKKSGNWHFVRNTIFTVLLWTGLWGLISLFIQQYFSSFQEQIIIYIIMIVISFYFIKKENIN